MNVATKVRTGTLYKVDGTVEKIAPKNGQDFKLEELQKVVGGYIEVIMLGESSKIIIINEEGKLIGLPANRKATREWTSAFRGSLDWIAGDAIICETDMVR